MTNSAKKPAKTSRDNLDLDLDARLDQATSMLSLDDEPVVGDALDQVLAHAKKVLDSDLPPVVTEVVTEPDDIILDDNFDDLLEINEPDDELIKPESLATLETQLATAMESHIVSDEELDNLLGGAGYDFDSLLGDANDELTADEAELNEDSLMATVDELLNFGVEIEAIEPEIELEIEAIEPEIIEPNEVVEFNINLDDLDEVAEKSPEIETIAKDEIVDIEPEFAFEFEVVDEPEIEDVTHADIPELNFEFETDKIVESEVKVATEETVDIEESEIAIEDEIVELKEPTEVELTVEPEVALDDLIDTVPFENALKTDANDAEIEDIFVEEFNDFENVADIAAPLVEISLPSDDELGEAQHLDGLNDAMENKNETTAGFDLLDDDAIEKENATPVAESDDDLDWMKQLDDLDAAETIKPVSLGKTEVESDDDLDWMKQLDDLDATEITQPAVEVESTDDDWMKQLDDLDAAEITQPDAETESADDDWMKQLEGMDEHDEDTAKMLMDAGHGHDTDEDTVVDHNFNIADDEPKNSHSAINEDALIAKAAEVAIEQFRGDQEALVSAFKDDQAHTLSQLRADQDTIESKTRKQFADAENGRKKTATFGYAALGVGILGLLGSGAIGYMSFGTKNDTETLTQSVTTLEEKVEAIVTKAPEKEKEIANIKTSVEQLNQKVEKLAAAQIAPVAPVVATATIEAGKTAINGKSTGTEKSPVNLLNSKTLAPVVPAVAGVKTDATSPVIDAPKMTETEITPPIDIAPAHPTGENKVEPKLSEMVKKPTVDAKAKAEKTAKAEAEKVKEKTDAALLTEKIAKITAIAKAASTNPKTEDQRKLLSENRASRYNGKMTRGMARGIAKERTEDGKVGVKKDVKNASTTAKKEILNTAVKPQKAIPVGKYAVNVVSYQQEWFAQSKAAEFRQKGIPVEVAPVDANSYATKYRLKVGGFKTKAEASAYAKKHGLSETWVSN